MNSAYVAFSTYNNQPDVQGKSTGIFGYVSSSTIKNLGFEDIKMQSLNDFVLEEDNSNRALYNYFDGEKIVYEGDEGYKAVHNTYLNCAIIRFAWNGSNLSNVYVEFDKSNFSEFIRTNVTSAFVAWAKASVIENCVVSVKNATYGGADNDFALDSINEHKETDTSRRAYYYNNICVGIKNAFPAYSAPFADRKFQEEREADRYI